MKTTTLVRIAGKSILRNKMRTLLTMLGIIIGVGAVIVMVALGSGAQQQVEERVGSLGTNMLVITASAAAQGGVSQGAQSFNRLTIEDAEAIRDQAMTLVGVSPVVVTRAQFVASEANWRAFVFGVHPDYQRIRSWEVESGAFFTMEDLRARRKVVLLGKTVAERLFPDQDPVGQTFRVRGVPVRVVGVLQRKGQTAEGTDQDDVVIAPYTTVQTSLSGRSFIGQILASTASLSDIPAAQEEIRGILRDAHDLEPMVADDFEVRSQSDISKAAQETTRVMRLLLSAIASISLLVGGIGIMNIMLVSVTERTREIGLRMALGARGSDVLTQFLIEAIVMSLAGGALGVAVGLGGSALLGSITGWRTLVSPATIGVSLLFAGAVGVFFGFYPARRAASLDPIEALRYE